MKRTFRNILLGSALAATAFSSCKKAWFDINKDPNNPVETNVTPEVLAPSALLNAANRTVNSYAFLNNWLGYWAPGANYSPNVEEQSYNITTGFNQGIFGNILDNGFDFDVMDKKATETNQKFYSGIAKIMKAYNFSQLVDIYNNVPYSESYQGIKNVRPKYDDGKDVYEDCMKRIDSGIALIKAAKAGEDINISGADVMFGGNAGKWVRFANTLKLRLLMHQAFRDDRATYIQTEIAKIQAEGSGFLGSGEDASVSPGFQVDKPNAIWANFGYTTNNTQATDFWRANIISMNYLKNDNDPRLAYFYRPIVNTVPTGAPEPFAQLNPKNYRGNQYGLPINNTQYPYQTADYVSMVGGVWDRTGKGPKELKTGQGDVKDTSYGILKGYNMRVWILTSVESFFLQAEAKERGWLGGAPGANEQAYKDAVRESFRWLNVAEKNNAAANDAIFNTWYNDQDGLNNANTSYTKSTDKLALIIRQKYMALNGISPLEVWTDYRRASPKGKFPNIPLSVNPGRTSSTLPYRLLYPQREYELNTQNVKTQGTINQFTSKIWWQP